MYYLKKRPSFYRPSNPVLKVAAKQPLESVSYAYVSAGLDGIYVINTVNNAVEDAIILPEIVVRELTNTPDSTRLYVVDRIDNRVIVISTITKSIITTIPVGESPTAIAITPDGSRAYVTNAGGNGYSTVSVINTATNKVMGPPITVGRDPFAIAITPDGSRAYVVNTGDNTVSVINTATNQVIASIYVGKMPSAIAINPNGAYAYVVNLKDDTVSVINTATNQVVIEDIPVGRDPIAIAITPDGLRAYVANSQSDTVSVINTTTNQVIGPPIAVGSNPRAIAITPNGSIAYVVNSGSFNTPGSISVINTINRQIIGPPINIKNPYSITIAPALSTTLRSFARDWLRKAQPKFLGNDLKKVPPEAWRFPWVIQPENNLLNG